MKTGTKLKIANYFLLIFSISGVFILISVLIIQFSKGLDTQLLSAGAILFSALIAALSVTKTNLHSGLIEENKDIKKKKKYIVYLQHLLTDIREQTNNISVLIVSVDEKKHCRFLENNF